MSRQSRLVSISQILGEASDKEAIKFLEFLQNELKHGTLGQLVASLMIPMRPHLSHDTINNLSNYCQKNLTDAMKNKRNNDSKRKSVCILMRLPHDIFSFVGFYLTKWDAINIGICNHELYQMSQCDKFLCNNNIFNKLTISMNQLKIIHQNNIDLYHWCINCHSLTFTVSASDNENYEKTISNIRSKCINSKYESNWFELLFKTLDYLNIHCCGEILKFLPMKILFNKSVSNLNEYSNDKAPLTLCFTNVTETDWKPFLSKYYSMYNVSTNKKNKNKKKINSDKMEVFGQNVNFNANINTNIRRIGKLIVQGATIAEIINDGNYLTQLERLTNYNSFFVTEWHSRARLFASTLHIYYLNDIINVFHKNLDIFGFRGIYIDELILIDLFKMAIDNGFKFNFEKQSKQSQEWIDGNYNLDTFCREMNFIIRDFIQLDIAVGAAAVGQAREIDINCITARDLDCVSQYGRGDPIFDAFWNIFEHWLADLITNKKFELKMTVIPKNKGLKDGRDRDRDRIRETRRQASREETEREAAALMAAATERKSDREEGIKLSGRGSNNGINDPNGNININNINANGGGDDSDGDLNDGDDISGGFGGTETRVVELECNVKKLVIMDKGATCDRIDDHDFPDSMHAFESFLKICQSPARLSLLNWVNSVEAIEMYFAVFNNVFFTIKNEQIIDAWIDMFDVIMKEIFFKFNKKLNNLNITLHFDMEPYLNLFLTNPGYWDEKTKNNDKKLSIRALNYSIIKWFESIAHLCKDIDAKQFLQTRNNICKMNTDNQFKLKLQFVIGNSLEYDNKIELCSNNRVFSDISGDVQEKIDEYLFTIGGSTSMETESKQDKQDKQDDKNKSIDNCQTRIATFWDEISQEIEIMKKQFVICANNTKNSQIIDIFNKCYFVKREFKFVYR